MSGFSTSPFEENGNQYSVAVDMNYFHPSEMSVKVIDNAVVVVEAKHKERPDDQFGCISRHFLHRYRLPNNVDPSSITSDLSDKGILTVTATKVFWETLKIRGLEVKRPIWKRLYPSEETKTEEKKKEKMEEEDICDESDFILDSYEHINSGLFYTVTRIIGQKSDVESEIDYFEKGCDCGESGCTTESGCACLKYGTNYRLVEEGVFVLNEIKFGNSPVFECHFRCSCFARLKQLRLGEGDRIGFCGRSCGNRYVQFGPIEHLKVFDAGTKGWGLKTERKIRKGSFICEYAGEVIDLGEAIRRQNDQTSRGHPNYVFILREYSGNVLRHVTCVDPGVVGNVGRYINHSCMPNAAIVPVRVNNSVPWLCVFAIRDIEPEEEISFDYSGGGGCREKGKTSSPGNRKPCHCGATECRRFLPFANLGLFD